MIALIWLSGDVFQTYIAYFLLSIANAQHVPCVVDEITKDVSLVITDFAYEDEVDESKMLWESQIADLKKLVGSS